uniref:Glycosyltransferase 2-like domain-containing protein n=1 Tax=viral metagenome TaxID=1070528 RepID=A0A6C0H9N7_9ZZZZ
MISSETYGFVITRHINSEKTNKYWNECYSCIRKFYPTNIVMIIDDNSKYEYIQTLPETPPLTNVFFIQSEFHGRGELLPYYYLNKYKLFQTAIIIHDSVFIQQPIPVTNPLSSTSPTLIWNFQHHWETHPDITNEIKSLISKLNPQHTQRLLELYEKKHQWTGCFGVMSIINTEYISTTLHQTYHLFNLLEHITTRTHRCCLERVFGLICADSIKTPAPAPALLGDIHHYINQYCNWEYDFDQYMNDKNNINIKLQQFPMIKTHSGR